MSGDVPDFDRYRHMMPGTFTYRDGDTAINQGRILTDLSNLFAQLDRIEAKIDDVRRITGLDLKLDTEMSKELDDLTAAVEAEGSVIDSAIALITGLAARIGALITPRTDPDTVQQINKLLVEVQAKSDALGAAVVANTPSDVPPAPTPPVEAPSGNASSGGVPPDATPTETPTPDAPPVDAGSLGGTSTEAPPADATTSTASPDGAAVDPNASVPFPSETPPATD